jgi:hypothetical protein
LLISVVPGIVAFDALNILIKAFEVKELLVLKTTALILHAVAFDSVDVYNIEFEDVKVPGTLRFTLVAFDADKSLAIRFDVVIVLPIVWATIKFEIDAFDVYCCVNVRFDTVRLDIDTLLAVKEFVDTFDVFIFDPVILADVTEADNKSVFITILLLLTIKLASLDRFVPI